MDPRLRGDDREARGRQERREEDKRGAGLTGIIKIIGIDKDGREFAEMKVFVGEEKFL